MVVEFLPLIDDALGLSLLLAGSEMSFQIRVRLL
jgi:hypothetical protein